MLDIITEKKFYLFVISTCTNMILRGESKKRSKCIEVKKH